MRIDREIDGKQEFDYGKEELDKNPKGSEKTVAKKKKRKGKKSILLEKWDMLKAALNHDEAFMNMAAEDGLAETEAEEAQVEDQDQHPELAESGADMADEQTDAGVDPKAPLVEDTQDEGSNTTDDDQAGVEQSDEDKENQIAAMLSEEGHTDAEIAHIIHGHSSPEQDFTGEIKVAGAQQDMGMKDAIHSQDIGHKQRMQELEYERASKEDDGSEDRQIDRSHKQRMQDVEYQRVQAEDDGGADREMERAHRNRMLDLEYDKAQAEKDLDMTYKQKELEVKAKLLEQSHVNKMKLAEEKAKHSAAEQKVSLREKSADRKVKLKEKK